MSFKSAIVPQRTTQAPTQKSRVMGSWKNKITATELLEERANCDFDLEDFRQALTRKEVHDVFEQAQKDMREHPTLANSPDYYEMTPEEKQLMWFKKLNYIWFKMPEARKRYFIEHPNP